MTAITLSEILFWSFSTLLVLASTMAVFARQTIHNALWLVFAFFNAATLWMMLQTEFLALMLILVYVGAIMTLFLFIIMTLPNSPASSASNRKFQRVLLALAIPTLWLGIIAYTLITQTESISVHPPNLTMEQKSDSNTQALGKQIYTRYVYPFEIAGVLLLVAIIASISLTGGHVQSSKWISKGQQIQIKREDRIKLIKGESFKK